MCWDCWLLSLVYFLFLGHLLHNTFYDGIASMLIGIILIVISGVLVRESKGLLMGKTIIRQSIGWIVRLVQVDEAVVRVKKHFSMYLAPEEIRLHLNIVFKDELDTQQITTTIERIIRNIREAFPRMKEIFIEPVDP